MKKVMVLEPNPYHTEVVLGIVKYFEDLGYVVDVYLRQEVRNNKAFCRYHITGETIYFWFKEVPDILKSNDIQNYDFLFLTSMEHSEHGKVERFLNEIDTIPKTKYGVLGIYHTTTFIDTFRDYELQKQHRLFFLSDFQKGGLKEFPVLSLSPITFTNSLPKSRKLSKPINLLTIGTSADFSIFSDAYWRLSKSDRKKIRVKHIGTPPRKVYNLRGFLYEIFCIVYGLIEPKYRRCNNIAYLGKLNFADMFDEIEKADYVLVLIDPHIGDQKRYIQYSTSGIRQIILGFSKVGIMHNDVAEKYGFTQDAYIGYASGKLLDALRKVIEMSQNQYDLLVEKTCEVRQSIYQNSLLHISQVVKEITDEE